jgi:hypothetical protein
MIVRPEYQVLHSYLLNTSLFLARVGCTEVLSMFSLGGENPGSKSAKNQASISSMQLNSVYPVQFRLPVV